MVIWKFPLKITDKQFIQMPSGAKILSVANQSMCLCLWAMVVPTNPLDEICIEIFGTGNPILVGMGVERRFIGTLNEPINPSMKSQTIDTPAKRVDHITPPASAALGEFAFLSRNGYNACHRRKNAWFTARKRLPSRSDAIRQRW
jgi:hypothetical protein